MLIRTNMLQLKNKSETENNYKTVAKFFHWSMALLIIVNYILGLTLDSTSWYLVHKQIGITILFLCILRICLPLKLVSLNFFREIG